MVNLARVGLLEGIKPVFIVGAPRSGTTLLRNMLNRHPAIGICDETYYFYYVYSRRRAFGDLANDNARSYLITQYLSTNRIARLGLNPVEFCRTLMAEGMSYKSFFSSLLCFYAKQYGKVRCGEKTPQHSYYVKTLCDWFPQCRLIHLIRDPRDVVASLLTMPWASRSVLANTRNWLRNVSAAEEVDNKSNLMRVFYEDLVLAPEAILADVCDFIGEEYTSDMLSIPDITDSKNHSLAAREWWFERAKQPIDKDRLGKWRSRLSDDQIALIERVAHPFMDQFGYTPTSGQPSRKIIMKAVLEEQTDLFVNHIRHRGHYWYYWFHPTKIAQDEAWIDR